MPVSYTSPQIRSLLAELKELRASCIAMEQEFGASIAEGCPQSKRSVQTLLHYLALRKHDLRDLQSRLAALGLSSLGRSESSTLAGLDAVIAILESLAGEQSADPLPSPHMSTSTLVQPSLLSRPTISWDRFPRDAPFESW
jgi:pyruvate kinase